MYTWPGLVLLVVCGLDEGGLLTHYMYMCVLLCGIKGAPPTYIGYFIVFDRYIFDSTYIDYLMIIYVCVYISLYIYIYTHTYVVMHM